MKKIASIAVAISIVIATSFIPTEVYATKCGYIKQCAMACHLQAEAYGWSDARLQACLNRDV
jgi:hypothetical protein